MGLVRRRGCQSNPHIPQTSQVGNHDIFSDAGIAHARGLHETRPRAPRPRGRALRAIVGRTGDATLGGMLMSLIERSSDFAYAANDFSSNRSKSSNRSTPTSVLPRVAGED